MDTREWKNRWLVLLSPDWNGPRLSGVRSYLQQRYRYVDASATSNGHTQGAVSSGIVHVGVGGGGGGRRSRSTHVVTLVVGSKAAKGFIKFWKWEYWVTTSWGGGGCRIGRAWGGYGMGRASHQDGTRVQVRSNYSVLRGTRTTTSFISWAVPVSCMVVLRGL